MLWPTLNQLWIYLHSNKIQHTEKCEEGTNVHQTGNWCRRIQQVRPPKCIVGIILQVLWGNLFPRRLVSLHDQTSNQYWSVYQINYYYYFFAMFKRNPTQFKPTYPLTNDTTYRGNGSGDIIWTGEHISTSHLRKWDVTQRFVFKLFKCLNCFGVDANIKKWLNQLLCDNNDMLRDKLLHPGTLCITQ